MRTAGIVRVGSAAWLILTIKSRESVISVAGVCGTFHPELPPLLALVDGGLDVVEPVPDALLQPQVDPALCLLADGDCEVASLIQQRHRVNVGQFHLQSSQSIILSTVTFTRALEPRKSSNHNRPSSSEARSSP